jgi:hypothetical protein
MQNQAIANPGRGVLSRELKAPIGPVIEMAGVPAAPFNGRIAGPAIYPGGLG